MATVPLFHDFLQMGVELLEKVVGALLVETFWLAVGAGVGLGGVMLAVELALRATHDTSQRLGVMAALFTMPTCAAISGAAAALFQLFGAPNNMRRLGCLGINLAMFLGLVFVLGHAYFTRKTDTEQSCNTPPPKARKRRKRRR